MSDQRFSISMHHIPVRGGIGVGLIIAFLVALMLNELPQLRWPVLGSVAGGVVLGAALSLWRQFGLRDAGPADSSRTFLPR
jgi:hypothetical protein